METPKKQIYFLINTENVQIFIPSSLLWEKVSKDLQLPRVHI